MADTVIKTTFQFRRGLAATWTSKNPVLAYGEPGFEKDTYRLKIGDGTTAWNDLAYFGGTGTIEVDGKSISIVGGKLSLEGFNEAAPGQVPSKGADGKIAWINLVGGVKRGYYYNDAFYNDTAHTTLIPASIDYIYIDNSTFSVYVYDGSKYVQINEADTPASDTTAGIMKLYNTVGNNTDGTIN